ncbi:hypothetical protein Tco_1345743 [Tanacetum coccineum]
MLEVAPTTLEGVNQRVTELDTIVRQRTDEDRPYHRHTAMILDREVMYARIAWTSSEDRSTAIEAHVRTLEAQSPRMSQLRLAAAVSHVSFVAILYSLLSFMGTLIERGVAAVLAECDADRSRNGDDRYDSGTDRRRQESTVRECTYTEFLKCQPMNFKGTEGVVGLTQWKCLDMVELPVRAVGHDIAYAMPWKTLKKMMIDKYYPRELVLMCDRMFPEESDVVEKYVGGLPDMIHGSVKASKPKTMQKVLGKYCKQT